MQPLLKIVWHPLRIKLHIPDVDKYSIEKLLYICKLHMHWDNTYMNVQNSNVWGMKKTEKHPNSPKEIVYGHNWNNVCVCVHTYIWIKMKKLSYTYQHGSITWT